MSSLNVDASSTQGSLICVFCSIGGVCGLSGWLGNRGGELIMGSSCGGLVVGNSSDRHMGVVGMVICMKISDI